jgi:hypothetical protein
LLDYYKQEAGMLDGTAKPDIAPWPPTVLRAPAHIRGTVCSQHGSYCVDPDGRITARSQDVAALIAIGFTE